MFGFGKRYSKPRKVAAPFQSYVPTSLEFNNPVTDPSQVKTDDIVMVYQVMPSGLSDILLYEGTVLSEKLGPIAGPGGEAARIVYDTNCKYQRLLDVWLEPNSQALHGVLVVAVRQRNPLTGSNA